MPFSLIPQAHDIGPTEIIHEEEDDVGFAMRGRRCADGKRAQGQAEPKVEKKDLEVVHGFQA